jgi:hypothetical protein
VPVVGGFDLVDGLGFELAGCEQEEVGGHGVSLEGAGMRDVR